MKRTLASSNTNITPYYGLEKYASTCQIPPDILYKDSRYFRKDKKDFSLNDTGRVVDLSPKTKRED